MISLRLMILNFASIFSTAGVLTNLLLDLSGADPDSCYWEGLRAEVEKVRQECGDVWTEESLARLWKVDSALKETMRKWSVLSYGMPRKVISCICYLTSVGSLHCLILDHLLGWIKAGQRSHHTSRHDHRDTYVSNPSQRIFLSETIPIRCIPLLRYAREGSPAGRSQKPVHNLKYGPGQWVTSKLNCYVFRKLLCMGLRETCLVRIALKQCV
jgi:hypothetical protein